MAKKTARNKHPKVPTKLSPESPIDNPTTRMAAFAGLLIAAKPIVELVLQVMGS